MQWRKLVFLLLGLSLSSIAILITFQNCAVRRLEGGDEVRLNSSGKADLTAAGANVNSCLIGPSVKPEDFRIDYTPKPVFKSSYAMLDRQNAIGSEPPITALTLIMGDTCQKESTLLTAQKCSALCQTSETMLLMIRIKCGLDNTLDNCHDLTEGSEYDLSKELDAALFMTIMFTHSKSDCENPTNNFIVTYMPPFSIIPKSGKLVLKKGSSLALGSDFTVELKEVLVSKLSATGKIPKSLKENLKLSGTVSGKIISIPACVN